MLEEFQPVTTLKQWVEDDPEALALVGESMTLSASELLEVLYAVANGLSDAGVTTDSLVGVDIGDELAIICALALPVELAHTGANAGLIAGIAGSLMAAGGSLVLIAQRRIARRTK